MYFTKRVNGFLVGNSCIELHCIFKPLIFVQTDFTRGDKAGSSITQDIINFNNSRLSWSYGFTHLSHKPCCTRYVNQSTFHTWKLNGFDIWATSDYRRLKLIPFWHHSCFNLQIRLIYIDQSCYSYCFDRLHRLSCLSSVSLFISNYLGLYYKTYLILYRWNRLVLTRLSQL